EIVSSTKDPEQALEAMVDHHLDFVFERTDHITTWRNEFRSLPEGDRRRLRYLQRLYVEDWVHTVKQLRTDLDVDEVRTLCHAAIALLQSPVMFQSSLARERMTPLLHSAAVTMLRGAGA
ncbi:MAG: TetR/AcrR family transcriptional regulator, partial [Mycobacteriales bacterium]